jgi:hypothetical protein
MLDRMVSTVVQHGRRETRLTQRRKMQSSGGKSKERERTSVERRGEGFRRLKRREIAAPTIAVATRNTCGCSFSFLEPVYFSYPPYFSGKIPRDSEGDRLGGRGMEREGGGWYD